MKWFLALSVFVTTVLASAMAFASNGNVDCNNLNLNGTWQSEARGYFFRHPKTYEIKQQGCYVLVFDTYRKATWKIDLTGKTPIKAPAEIIEVNRNATGPAGEKNIRNLEVKLTPDHASSNFWGGKVESVVQLDPLPHFPYGIKAEMEGELQMWLDSHCGGCSSDSSDRIKVVLRRVNVLDLDGVTGFVDKPSFISGINTFLFMFLKGFGYRTDLFTLVRVSTP